MSKKFDFTKTGGFPLDQDRLDFMQNAYYELVMGLSRASGHSVGPYSMGGAEASFPTIDAAALTKGLIFYDDKVLVIGTDLGISGMAGGDEAYIIINDNNASLVYKDTTSKEVQLDNYCTIEGLPSGTSNDSTRFRLADLKPYGRERDWSDLSSTFTGSILGTAEYKKVMLTNQVLLRGNFGPNTASTFTGSYVTSATIPNGYWPSQEINFVAAVAIGFGVMEDTGKDYLRQINCKILPTGELQVQWLNSATTVGYNVEFDISYTMD
jgi:hypothetical protein